MKKSVTYPPIIHELKRSLSGAQDFYNRRGLASRRRKPVDSNAQDLEEAFDDYLTLQAIEYGFIREWAEEVQLILKKVKRVDQNDYKYSLGIFDRNLSKDKGEFNTAPFKLEQKIENLREIIDWLSENYLTGRTGPFSYDLNKNHLKRGNEIIIDYSVGKRKGSNSYLLLRKLFRKEDGNYGQYCCTFDQDSGKRPMYHARKLINDSTGTKLILRKRYRHNRTVIYKLNPDLI
jgi:hypothetical protein